MTKRISASQVELFTRCQRRWAFSYRAGKKEPFAESAQAGTEVHRIIELNGPFDSEWVGPETEKVYLVGQMAALLKSQAPGISAHEQRFEVEIDGVPLVGVVDAQSEDKKTIVDFKTTSRVRNAKSVEKLTEDPQRLMYTQFVPEAERTVWLYGAWDTMAVTPRAVEIDRAADRERFKLRVIQPAERMLSVASDVDPLSLPPNVNDCALFPAPGGKGGCPHKHECFPTGKLMPVTTTTKQGTSQMSSLIERLRAKAAAAGAPELPASEPAKDSIATKIAYPVPSEVETESTEDAASRAQFEAVFKPVTLPPPGPESVEAAEPAKKPRRRKPKTESAPSQPEPAGESMVDAVQNSEPQTSVAPTQKYIVRTLYVNCLPMTEPFTSAHTLIAEAAETVQNDLQVPHYGLVDFAKGGPALAAQLRANISGRYYENLYLETKSAEGKAVLNVLTAVSERIVQGVF